MKELDLGKERISKLIKKFAIPCTISMIVAALYNIVDQIFIGWSSAGAYGNAATNIVYPFTVIALAFALLAGDGSAALFSISLGANDKKKANKSVGNGLVWLIIFSALLTIVGLVFKDNILKLFGGNPEEELCYSYAKDYLTVICLGIPFYVIGQGLNASIRSDGSPRYAMIATLIGAISNIILDPIFIFVFDMSVKGAAIATVIGQVLTFIISIIYLTKSKTFKATKDSLKLDKSISLKLMSLGLASLITQIAIVIIIAVANNIVSKYGYVTLASTNVPYGVVTPLAVIGICMKVFGIVISIVIGISLGGQPIIGYNMGAGNINRVKETCMTILKINALVGLLAFILFEFFPNVIINIFGSNNTEEYLEYAKLCLNIYLGGIILTCLIKSMSILLQSMGSSFKSTLLALSRDVIFFVPATLMIASISKSVVTMLYSAIIADSLAFILGSILLVTEFKKLDKLDELNNNEKENNKENNNDNNNEISENNFEKNNSKLRNKIVITISREFGSSGHYIGKMLASNLGIDFYDKQIIKLTADKLGYSENYIKQNEEESIKNMQGNIYYLNNAKIFEAETKVINELAKKSCVIVGRCADYILRNKKEVYKIFLYTDEKSRIERVIKYHNIKTKEEAQKEITRVNKQRRKHYNDFTGKEWDDINNYDIALNVDKLGTEKTIELITNIILSEDKEK